MSVLVVAGLAVGIGLPTSSQRRCGPIMDSLRSDHLPVEVQLAAESIRQLQREEIAAAPITDDEVDSARRVVFVGGATVTRSIAGSLDGFQRWIAEPVRSDASLLNTVSCEALGNDCYRCEMARIAMLSYRVTPLLTVRIERGGDPSSLLIRVIDVSISIQGGRDVKPWVLRGARVESTNRVSWRSEGDAETELRTELRLRVGVELPRLFPLPRAAIERPGSLILQATCDAQCRQFLTEIEEGYRAGALVSSGVSVA